MSLYSSTVLADNPLAYWRLGDLTGTSAADSSGHGNVGTYVGGYTLDVTPGAIHNDPNPCVGFDGTGYVDNSVAVSGAFTLEAWIFPTSVGAVEAPIIGDGLVLVPPNSLGIGASGGLSGYDVTLSVWTHVVEVSDGTNLSIYANGVLQKTIVDSFSYTAGQARIGGRPDIGPNPDWSFHGLIDEVAIYSSALSAMRILAHYNAGLGIIARGGGFAAWWAQGDE